MKKKNGTGCIDICVMIIVLCSILSVLITYVSAVNVIQINKRNARIVLDSFVMENSIEIYDSIKNGNDITDAVDTEKYINSLCSYNSLDFRGNMLYCVDENGNQKYRMTAPYLILTEGNRLKLAAKYEITVPLYFAGIRIHEAKVPITVESKLKDKF